MSGAAADSLLARIAAQAERRPDALALQCGERSLSYRQLLELIEATAQRPRAGGLGAGALLGWLGLNSPEMLAALFACARLGAVFVPLNWRLAAPELAAVADHAGLAALEHDIELAPLAAELKPRLRPSGEAASTQPGDLMLAYTSGTSGQPKGAMHTEAAMLANIDAALAVQPIGAGSRVLAVLPMFHVGGLCIQVLPALAAGAAVRLLPRFDALSWLRTVADWRPTTSLLVPAVMRALVEHPVWPAADLSSLQFVNSGSSIVPLSLIEAFHARGVAVAQVYGCTESGPLSVALHPRDALRRAGLAGWPAPGVQLRLVDAGGRDTGEGNVGEVWLKAPNVMRGYHREPAPAGLRDGWFATGDLARRHADGCVELVGRSTDLIISGGEHVHPAEIENLVAGWPGVADCAVLGLPDARWGEVALLVIAAKPGATVDLAALRREFDARLARFKHPRRIELVDALPKTALGKVQKALLAARFGAAR